MVSLIVLSGLFLVRPRSIHSGKITLACATCGQTITVKRWELIAPEWLHIRYPGWTSTTEGASQSTAQPISGCAHLYSVQVAVELVAGACNLSGPPAPAGSTHINGVRAIPENAATILDALMSPENDGITITGPANP